MPILGFTTEPLPRAGQDSHDQLEAQPRASWRRPTARNFDRVICFDPYGWDAAAQHLPVWRCMPLPVDDRLYRPVTAARRPPRVIFIGYSTWHRETYLIAAKHEFDIGHYAHGLIGSELRDALAGADVGINLHGALNPLSFENRVLLHLASGHLAVLRGRSSRRSASSRGSTSSRSRARTTSACACTSSTTSPTPSSASASAVATRPTSSAPRASGPT